MAMTLGLLGCVLLVSIVALVAAVIKGNTGSAVWAMLLLFLTVALVMPVRL